MKLLSVLKKDLQILLKDRGQLAVLFLMPLAFILPISFAMDAVGGLGPGDQFGTLTVFAPDAYQQNVLGYTVMFVFFIVRYVSSAIHREKVCGTFRRLLSVPVSRAALLDGKLLSAFIVGVLQVAVMFTVGALVFALDMGRDWIALVLLTMALAAAAATMGLAAAALRISSGALTPPLIIFALVGGCMLPLDMMPFLRPISVAVPHSWALNGYQDLMVRGQGLPQVLPEIGVLVALALVFFVIAVWRFDFEEEKR